MWLNIKTEYSFRSGFPKMEDIVAFCKENKAESEKQLRDFDLSMLGYLKKLDEK